MTNEQKTAELITYCEGMGAEIIRSYVSGNVAIVYDGFNYMWLSFNEKCNEWVVSDEHESYDNIVGIYDKIVSMWL